MLNNDDTEKGAKPDWENIWVLLSPFHYLVHIGPILFKLKEKKYNWNTSQQADFTRVNCVVCHLCVSLFAEWCSPTWCGQLYWTVTHVTAAASVLIQLPPEHVQTASVAAAPEKLGSSAVLPFFSQVELLIYKPRQKHRAQQRRNACEASPAETPRKF